MNPNPDTQPNDGAPVDGAGALSSGSLSNSLDKEELLERIIGWHRVDSDHWHDWRGEAADCYQFRAGNQWAPTDMDILREQGRPAITFNRIGPFVDSVGGLEINNRQETMYAPRQVGATGVNDILTAAAKWARDECDAEDEETEAFLDVVTCGIGCTQSRMDYDDDPDGLIAVDRVDPLEMLPDSGSRKQNFSDARRVMRVKDVPIEVARDMLPDFSDQELDADWAADQAEGAQDPHDARAAPYYRNDQSARNDRDRTTVRMVECEWWQFEPAWRVLDPATGRFVLLSEEKAAIYAMRARLIGMKPAMIRDRRKRYFKAIVGSIVLKVMDGPERGGFSYKFITGKRDAIKGTWYGLVRAMRDPQMWANKWLSQGLHIVNTNAKGGLLAEADAFDDPDEARDSWAEADSITLLNPGGLGKVQQKEPPAFPNQINAMMQLAIDAIPMVSGINMELMGQSTSTAPQVGMVEVGRKQQGMNVLASIFNAKRRYQKEQGRLLLWMIQTFIADGRLIRVGGPGNAQYVPLIHDPGVAEYDVIVEDAPTSPNMKDRVWAALMNMFPMLRGMAIPPEFYINALKYAPVPAAFVTESQQILSQPPPANPALQGKEALDAARAKEAEARAAALMAETQAIPASNALDAAEQQARIEHIRAQAINQLQNAGIVQDDMKFRQTMDAINTLLGVHGAALRHDAQGHQHAMDLMQAAQPPQPVDQL